jgi:hypothetical protein
MATRAGSEQQGMMLKLHAEEFRSRLAAQPASRSFLRAAENPALQAGGF